MNAVEYRQQIHLQFINRYININMYWPLSIWFYLIFLEKVLNFVDVIKKKKVGDR